MPNHERYTDWQEIGRGGCGSVYKVYDQTLQRFVAIKLLLEKLASRQELIAIMRQEVIISRDLRHPNICPIHDIYEGPRGIGTVMDLIRGMELRRWMEVHKYPLHATVSQRLEIFLKLTEALAVAHTRIIHRDLKPANIFLVEDNPARPMIMDFGASVIGRMVEGEGDITGTLRYMSPEQWEAPHKVDARSDLFALGVLAYELFTNRLPPVSLRQVQKTGAPPRVPLSAIALPSHFCQPVPPALDRLLVQLLAYRQEDRPQSAEDVVAVLREVRLNPLASGPTGGQEMAEDTVALPGGVFYLGSKAGLGQANEKPARPVRLTPFRMQVHPVTNLAYRRFLQATGHPPPSDLGSVFGHGDHPVVGVSWWDAMAYATWAGGQLPSEAQWEYAAKGGQPFPAYPWGDEPVTPSRANIHRTSSATSPVESYPAGRNPFGIQDLCGNVWEWCRDTWHETFYRTLTPDTTDPCCTQPGEEKVLRGGSFDSLASQGRCSFRFHAPGQQKNRAIGFRLVFPV